MSVNRSARFHRTLPLVGMLVGLCTCTGLCAVVVGSGLFESVTQKGNVEAVIDAFMHAMATKSPDQAFSLLSARAQKREMPSNLEAMLSGKNFALFDGYSSVEVLNLSVGPSFNTNTNTPQGTVARASGVVRYGGGFQGYFQAVLEKDNGSWKLFSINVTVPPEKLNNYLRDNP